MQNNQDAIREAMRLAKSPAGQQLLEALQKSNAKELRQAMNSATAGNYAQARQVLSGLLEDPEIRRLFAQMGGNHGPDGR